MAPGLIAFLSAGWRLLELADPSAAARLVDEWEVRFGSPDFSEDGDSTVGFHAPGHNPGERHLLVGRTANEQALGTTMRLLTLRYGLSRLSIVGRPLHDPGRDDWTPDLTAQPPNMVTVWPSSELPVKDCIVIEYGEQPGLFVHRARAVNRGRGCRPAERVECALAFTSVEAATTWIERHDGEGPFALQYRSVALAYEDQAATERNPPDATPSGSEEESS